MVAAPIIEAAMIMGKTLEEELRERAQELRMRMVAHNAPIIAALRLSRTNNSGVAAPIIPALRLSRTNDSCVAAPILAALRRGAGP